jgi:EmrB/QacA subfamily drug resistance transporter
MTTILDNQIEEEKSSFIQWIALFSIIFATFLEILDSSIMNVALPKLINVLNSTQDNIEWVATGYTLSSGIVTPLGGFLGDKYGYKRTMLTSVIAFIAFSSLCGIAWSDTTLIVFRILQGLAGGVIMPVGMAMLYKIMDRSKIQIAMGIWGISATAAPALGPTIGGFIVDNLDWRYLFFINIPIGLVSFLIGIFFLKETPKNMELRIDLPGILLSSVFFGSLLLAFSKGDSKGWTSFYIVSLLYVAISSLLLLLWVETGKENPIINLRLFKNKEFTLSTVISGIIFIAIQGGAYLLPIWYQNVEGLTPTQSGLELMPQALAIGVMMPIVGALSNKIGVIPFGVSGLILISLGTYKLSFITGDISNHELNLLLIIRGLGIGLCMMPVISAGMNTLSNELIGSASSLSSILRNVSAAFGISILTTYMSHRSTFYGAIISERFTNTTSTYADFQANVINRYLALGTDTSTAHSGVTGLIVQLIQKESMVRGMTDTFFLLTILSTICIPLVLLMRNKSSNESQDNMMIH